MKLTEPQLDKTLVDCRLNYPQLEVPVHTGSYVEIMAVFRGQVVQVVEDTSITLNAGSILLTSPPDPSRRAPLHSGRTGHQPGCQPLFL